MASVDDEPVVPYTVSDVLGDVSAVIERGDYANVGPRSEEPVARKSTVRRAFTQLREKGLIERVADLSPRQLGSDRIDLGEPGEDPDDPTGYSRTSEDARVTDWVLTEAGDREVRRLDEEYATELDELAARYGRPHGETTDRIDA